MIRMFTRSTRRNQQITDTPRSSTDRVEGHSKTKNIPDTEKMTSIADPSVASPQEPPHSADRSSSQLSAQRQLDPNASPYSEAHSTHFNTTNAGDTPTGNITAVDLQLIRALPDERERQAEFQVTMMAEMQNLKALVLTATNNLTQNTANIPTSQVQHQPIPTHQQPAPTTNSQMAYSQPTMGTMGGNNIIPSQHNLAASTNYAAPNHSVGMSPNMGSMNSPTMPYHLSQQAMDNTMRARSIHAGSTSFNHDMITGCPQLIPPQIASVMKVDIYQYDIDSKETFAAWADRYEFMCHARGLSDEMKAMYMQFYLKDTALYMYQFLPATTRLDFQALKSVMIERTSGKANRFAHRHALLLTKQESHEKVDTFYTRFMAKAQLCHSGTPSDDAWLGTNFRNNLRRAIREKIMFSEESSLEAVYLRAKEIEMDMELTERENMARGDRPSNNSRPYQNTNRYIPPPQRLPGYTNPQWQQFRPPAYSNPNNNWNNQQASRPNQNYVQQNRDANIICNNCGVKGHRISNCRKPQSRRNQPAQINEAGIPHNTNDQYETNVEDEHYPQGPEQAPPPEEQPQPDWEDWQQDARVDSLTVAEAQQAPNSPTTQIAPAPQLTLLIEGIEITAKLDSGADANIISRDALDNIRLRTNKKLEEKSWPIRLLDVNNMPVQCSKFVDLNVTEGKRTQYFSFAIMETGNNKIIYGNPIMSHLMRDAMMSSVSKGALTFPTHRFKPATSKMEITVGEISHIYTKRQSIIRARAEEMPSQNGNEPEGDQNQFIFYSNYEHIPDAIITTVDGSFDLVSNDINASLLLNQGNQIGMIHPLMQEEIELDDDDQALVKGARPTFVHAFAKDRLKKLEELFEKNVPQLDEVNRQQFIHWLLSKADQFAIDDSELGTCNLMEHHINTGNADPVRDGPRKYSYNTQQIIIDKIYEWEAGGVVERSKSPYCSQLHVVPKPDAKDPKDAWRVCVDLRSLNRITIDDAEPIPACSEIISRLGAVNAKFFSRLDMKSGFLQLMLSEDSKEKTAFQSPVGLFQFKRVCYGLCTATQSFSRLMQIILADFQNDPRVSFYVDDLLIATSTSNEMWDLLEKVFDKLKQADIKMGPAKCTFFVPELVFLGHVISGTGIKPDPAKIKSVEDFPVPTSVKQLQSFLGFVNYLRVFVPNMASIAAPLYDSIKKSNATKNKLEWNEPQQQAFDCIKQLLTTAPILILPDPHRDFVIEVDASDFSMGAALLQEGEDGKLRPIAFASRKFNTAQSNYSATMRELLAVVWGLQHFHQYIAAHKVVVYSDHSALLALKTKQDLPGILLRWSMKIDQYRPDIRHRPGRFNHLADALSRRDCPPDARRSIKIHYEELNDLHSKIEADRKKKQAPDDKHKDLKTEIPPTMMVEAVEDRPREEPVLMVTTDDLKNLSSAREAQMDDKLWGHLITYLETQTVPDDPVTAKAVIAHATSYEMVQGLLYRAPERSYGPRLVVPVKLRAKLMHENHALPHSGHYKLQKVYEKMRQYFYWPGMYYDIAYALQQCRICATRTGSGKLLRPPLKPLEVIPVPLAKVAIDLAKYPRSSSGNVYMLVIIDLFTKFVDAYALPDKKAATVADAFTQFCARIGIPKCTISDNGSEFTADLMQQTMKIFGIKHARTSTYSPASNGEVERMNRDYQNILAKIGKNTGADWDKNLCLASMAHNTSPHASTGESPYYLLMGRDPTLPSGLEISDYVIPRYAIMADQIDYVQEMVLRLRQIWQDADEAIKKAQSQYKHQHDKKSTSQDIIVGDRVMVLRSQLQIGETRKLASPFHGPYRVIRVTPTNADIIPVDDNAAKPETIHKNKLSKAHPALRPNTWLGAYTKAQRAEPIPHMRPRDQ